MNEILKGIQSESENLDRLKQEVELFIKSEPTKNLKEIIDLLKGDNQGVRTHILKTLSGTWKNIWSDLSEDLKNWVKSELLDCVNLINTWESAKQIAATISSLTSLIISSQSGEKWPRILTVLITSLQSENPYTKFTSFLVLSEIIPFYFETFSKYSKKLLPIYIKNLDSPYPEVRFSAIHSLCVYISVINSSVPNQYVETVKPIISCIQFLCLNSPDCAVPSIKDLTELAESEPGFFKQDFLLILQLLEEIKKGCNDDRVTAEISELVITVIELNSNWFLDKREMLVCTIHFVLESLVKIGINRNSESKRLVKVLLRAVSAVGESVLEYLLRIIEKVYLDKGVEEELFVANLILSELSVLIFNRDKFEMVLEIVKQNFEDRRNWLRWTAYRNVSKLIDMQDSELASKAKSIVIPYLKASLLDNDMKVRKKALKVFTKILEKSEKETIKSYSIDYIEVILQASTESCLSACLDILISFFSVSKQSLKSYFEPVLSSLLSLLRNSENFKVKIFDCMLALRKAVPRDQFLLYLNDYMQSVSYLFSISDSPIKSLITLTVYLQEAIQPYIQALLPQVFSAFSAQPEESLQVLLSIIDCSKLNFFPYAYQTIQSLFSFLTPSLPDCQRPLISSLCASVLPFCPLSDPDNRFFKSFLGVSLDWCLEETDIYYINDLFSKHQQVYSVFTFSVIDYEQLGVKYLAIFNTQGQASSSLKLTDNLFSTLCSSLLSKPCYNLLNSMYTALISSFPGHIGSNLTLLKHLTHHLAGQITQPQVDCLIPVISTYLSYSAYPVQKLSAELAVTLTSSLPAPLSQFNTSTILSVFQLSASSSLSCSGNKLKDLLAIATARVISHNVGLVAIDNVFSWWVDLLPLTSHFKSAPQLYDILADVSHLIPNTRAINTLLSVSFTEHCSAATMVKIKRLIQTHPPGDLTPFLSSKLARLQSLNSEIING